MFILLLGVLLWWGAHLWKRAVPGSRAAFGDKGKGIVAGALILSVILMIWGYRIAQGPFWWGPEAILKGINNLLMLVAFYMFAAAGMKTAITRYIRHPQLTGFAIWAVAHLLVNGDLPSLVLFGGLLAWALVEMRMLNRAQVWTAPPPAPIRKEAMAILGALIVFGVVGMIHTWLGYAPFGG